MLVTRTVVRRVSELSSFDRAHIATGDGVSVGVGDGVEVGDGVGDGVDDAVASEDHDQTPLLEGRVTDGRALSERRFVGEEDGQPEKVDHASETVAADGDGCDGVGAKDPTDDADAFPLGLPPNALADAGTEALTFTGV